MKPFAFLLPRLLTLARLTGLCLLVAAAAGCHRHADTRPASSLSAGNRAALDRYETLRAALAADDLIAARAAAESLAALLKPADAKASPAPVLVTAKAIATAPAIDRARQQFRTLSSMFIPIVNGVEGYYVMTCPMPSSGDWVQRSALADNPYLGRAMHEYGEVRK